MANGNGKDWRNWVISILVGVCAYLVTGWANTSADKGKKNTDLSQQNKTEIAVLKNEFQNLKDIVLEIRTDVKAIKNR